MGWIKYDNVTLTGTRKSYDPKEGWQSVRTYQGQEADIDSLASQCVGANIKFTVNKTEPMQIEITTDDDGEGGGSNTANESNETWDLDWESESAPLSLHPLFNNGVSDTVKMEIGVIEKEYDTKLDWTSGKPIKTLTPSRYSSYDAISQKYAQKRHKGIDKFTRYAPVLIHRIIGSTRAQIKASNQNVNKVMTVSPDATINKLGDEINDYEWLKLPAKKRMIGSKIELEQTYLGAPIAINGGWDDDLFT